ncbi:hypothetical protein SADUNF_Sadunf03G0127200 [Salix dunnii]|uniref:Leucine-rich repeat-containing N-terminal plant-type domain-containing protein n=1 Tax=Salix dunnii TaxID=1413687 RepID=A0A835N4I9_9ROSI|nr:hypothetical protein SADUNF_Sadunf03G0127200 [Salix dunnii]
MASSGDCDTEGDVLPAWKANLTDPSSLLQSWAPTLVNPCTWFHVTCNTNNSVVRVDLADAELSGILVSELGLRTNLLYLLLLFFSPKSNSLKKRTWTDLKLRCLHKTLELQGKLIEHGGQNTSINLSFSIILHGSE